LPDIIYLKDSEIFLEIDELFYINSTLLVDTIFTFTLCVSLIPKTYGWFSAIN
jgi:hypothetical protein